jgi:hypothetical protein
VQRDAQALGVFIDGTERTLILSAPIVDVAIDHENSKTSTGAFSVLLRNQEICFFAYDSKGGIRESDRKIKPKGQMPEPLCFAVSGSRIATGFAGGGIITFDSAKNSITRKETGLPGLRKLQFGGSKLFGLAKESTLFALAGETFVCPYAVFDYAIVDDDYLIVRINDSAVTFASVHDWTVIGNASQYLPIPTERDLFGEYLRNRQTPFYDVIARDVWSFLLGIRSLRLHVKTGCPPRGYSEAVSLDLLGRIHNPTPHVNELMFASRLFADKFQEAAETPRGDEVGVVESAMMSALLVQVDDGCSENAHAMLKSTAISLFEAGQYEKGAILLRIGRLDRMGVGYLMEYGQTELVMRFVRSCLEDEDRKKFTFMFGCRQIREKQWSEALRFFAACSEFHPVLDILFNLGFVSDAYLVLKHLQKADLVRPVTQGFERLLPEPLRDLDELCKLIESEFRNLLLE